MYLSGPAVEAKLSVPFVGSSYCFEEL